MTVSTRYRGRFAPSPTGPLHFGSLVAAVGSYLDAKHHQGIWLVRMEDLDLPRCIDGAAQNILDTLACFGLNSDEPVMMQSQRTDAYESALVQLQESGAIYPCACTRKEISDSGLMGIEGLVYPGTCRAGLAAGRDGRSWRVRTDICPSSPTVFTDALQGKVTQHLEDEVGDFVVKRADGLFAYQLAVVVDDAEQGITHIVRGADLLASTPRQIHLQHLLGVATPHYMHLPVAVNADGEKLSKQTLATPVDVSQPVATLLQVLKFLQQDLPSTQTNDVDALLRHATEHWDVAKLRGISAIHSCDS